MGLRRGIDRPAMERELARGTVQCCLNVHTVRPGDFFYVPAGTPHAIGAGVLLAEIQQTSDTTFRLFDWNRLDPATGRQRELHLEAALDSIDFQASPPLHTHVSPEDRALKTELLAPGACPHFTVSRRFLTGNTSLGAIDRFHILICLSGSGKVASSTCSTSLARGGVVLLPATAPFRCTADRTLELLDVTV